MHGSDIEALSRKVTFIEQNQEVSYLLASFFA